MLLWKKRRNHEISCLKIGKNYINQLTNEITLKSLTEEVAVGI